MASSSTAGVGASSERGRRVRLSTQPGLPARLQISSESPHHGTSFLLQGPPFFSRGRPAAFNGTLLIDAGAGGEGNGPSQGNQIHGKLTRDRQATAADRQEFGDSRVEQPFLSKRIWVDPRRGSITRTSHNENDMLGWEGILQDGQKKELKVELHFSTQTTLRAPSPLRARLCCNDSGNL